MGTEGIERSKTRNFLYATLSFTTRTSLAMLPLDELEAAITRCQQECPVEIKPSKRHGKGLFASRDIAEGEAICYYDGKTNCLFIAVKTDLFCVLGEDSPHHNSNITYVLDLMESWV
jgi:hypothetical protein